MSPRPTGADARRRWRTHAAGVPAPLTALSLLFVLSIAIVGVQLAQGDDQDGSRPVAEPVSGSGSSIGSGGPEAGDGVLPGEVQAPGLPAGEPGADPDADPSAEPLPEPERIRVPAMDLDERLIDLGIARDGTMQVPADPDRVGWFAGGARPGGPGPVVVAAHVDSLEGPAVFARLSEVGEGDEVLLDTAEGTARYVVTGVRAVPRDDFPTAEVFGATRGDVVRLITCHGPYDRGGIGYTENLVVTAERV